MSDTSTSDDAEPTPGVATAPGGGDSTSPAEERGAMPRLLGTGIIVVSVLVLLVTVAGLFFVLRDQGPTTYSYTVPAGTADRLAKGEKVSVMPTEIKLAVGDHLVVRNDDDELATIGLFTVRPGETVDTPFNTPGVFKGACAMSGDGQIRIVVT